MQIVIKNSPTADTRTCDWSKVSKEQLLESSHQHIGDVAQGLAFFCAKLTAAAVYHDQDMISGIDEFHDNFTVGFKRMSWFDKHLKVSRHHIDKEAGVPADVNLIDVLEHIADCVMAGMARSGSVFELKLPDELLQRALRNTVDMLEQAVVVE